MALICIECGSILTEEERCYYEYRCENCERAWADRIDAWLKGGEDSELDDLYSAPKSITQ